MSNSILPLPVATGTPPADDPDRPYAIFKDVYIPLRDGTRLSANIYLPFSTTKSGRPAPAIASLGPYGKDIQIDDFGLPAMDMYKTMYRDVTPKGPDSCFEVLDPLVWTKEFNYAVVRVDSRGIGKSEGRLDPFGYERTLEIEDDAEGQDLYDVIEWIGTQPWCSGKVATAGISYYGMIGYWTAIQQPPHLAAIICFEAAADVYQASRRGGIIGVNFQKMWFEMLVLPRQRGYGSLSEEELAAARADFVARISDSEYPTGKLWKILNEKRDFEKIVVPIFSAGNWTDAELHGPGNILAYKSVSSKHKWLQMHTGNHIKNFYEPEIIRRQKQFLDHFLKDDHENGMLKVPSMRFWIRSTDPNNDHFRMEESFPPVDSTNMDMVLGRDGVLSVADGADTEDASPLKFAGLTGRLIFNKPKPFDRTVEILGSPYLNISVSTDAEDMDLFIYFRAFSCDDQVVHLRGNHDEMQSSFVRGYWRLSHREENILRGGIPIVRRTAGSHVEKGRVYDVIVPLLPTSFRFLPGEKLQLEIGATNEEDTIGPLRHDGPERSQERFGGTNVVFSGGRLLLPVVHRHS